MRAVKLWNLQPVLREPWESHVPCLSRPSALFSFASGRVDSISPLGQKKAMGTNLKVVICLAFPHWSSKESSFSSRERRAEHTLLVYRMFFESFEIQR